MKLYREKDLAYIAGFLDGEGSITIGKAGPPNSHSARISIGNNNLAVLEWIQTILRCGSIRTAKRKYGLCYSILFTKKEGEIILPLLLPYLHIKKKNAEIILKYWQETRKWTRDPERKINLEKFRFDIQYLNRRCVYNETRLLPEEEFQLLKQDIVHHD